MNRPPIPHFHAGRPLSAKDMNRIVDELNRLAKISGDGTVVVNQTAAGPRLAAAASQVKTYLFKTASGGIPARNSSTGVFGSASCSVYADSGGAVSSSHATRVVYNKTLTAIGSAKEGLALLEGSKLVAINVVCG
jgi:hypothetical protein